MRPTLCRAPAPRCDPVHSPAVNPLTPRGHVTQRTRFLAVASCGLLPGPAHEFFCSRKLRLAPQDYSPWTPRLDAFWSVAILPLRDTRESWTWSVPITECSVILSEASLRAKSKDP